MPRARNSASIQPAPTPSRTRPPDRSCRVATHLAVGNAGRKGRLRTAVPSPTRRVAAAKNANVANGSSVRAVVTSGTGGDQASRSLIHTVSNPDSSTARANSRTSSLVEYGPQLRRLMLSFMRRPREPLAGVTYPSVTTQSPPKMSSTVSGHVAPACAIRLAASRSMPILVSLRMLHGHRRQAWRLRPRKCFHAGPPSDEGLRLYRLEGSGDRRSEEHTSELQSQFHLVCRLLLEK